MYDYLRWRSGDASITSALCSQQQSLLQQKHSLYRIAEAYLDTNCPRAQDKQAAKVASQPSNVPAEEGVETGTDSDDDSLEAYGLSEGEDEGEERRARHIA